MLSKISPLAHVNGGAEFSLRNRLINGNGLFGQRGNITNNTLTPAYGADRWVAGCVGGSGLSITTYAASNGVFSTNRGVWMSGSATNGIPYFAQRIEAQNVFDMNGKWTMFSGVVYQDTGSTVQFVPRISKANAVDNFSAITVLQTGSAFSVPSGVATPFSIPFLLGSSDASNGLMVELFTSSALTFSGKFFGISDMQFEKGMYQTPFEIRPVGLEMALCQRYCEIGPIGTAAAYYFLTGSYGKSTPYYFKTEKRATPTITIYGIGGYPSGPVGYFDKDGVGNTAISAAGATQEWFNLIAGASIAGQCGFKAECEL